MLTYAILHVTGSKKKKSRDKLAKKIEFDGTKHMMVSDAVTEINHDAQACIPCHSCS